MRRAPVARRELADGGRGWRALVVAREEFSPGERKRGVLLASGTRSPHAAAGASCRTRA
jgi:hypothetical protein